MDTQNCGKHCAKLVVPSSGSIVHRCSLRRAFAPLSSARIAWSGKARLSVRITACSDSRSASVTRSIGLVLRVTLMRLRRRRWIWAAARAAERHMFEFGGRRDGFRTHRGPVTSVGIVRRAEAWSGTRTRHILPAQLLHSVTPDEAFG